MGKLIDNMSFVVADPALFVSHKWSYLMILKTVELFNNSKLPYKIVIQMS